MTELYNFDDITLLPSTISHIDSRAEVSTRYPNGASPYWVAPMDTIISPSNVQMFIDSGANVILPRMAWKNFLLFDNFPTVKHNEQLFIALTLDECEGLINEKNSALLKFVEQFQHEYNQINILIDVANGHMSRIFEIGEQLKNKYSNCILMGGNIANPNILIVASSIFDYMRIGIGGGSRCLTSAKAAVHYPIASLIRDCRKIISNENLKVKIIADGGMRNIRDAVLTMALGADGVMMGKLYNSCIESCGETYLVDNGDEVNIQYPIKHFHQNGMANLFKQYRGMSTTEVQIKEGKKDLKMSEGFTALNPVLWDLKTFTYELDSSMRTAMSYCDSKTFEQFQTKAKFALTRNNNNHNKI
jgi:IMP dehydrogenase/GMP reductase